MAVWTGFTEPSSLVAARRCMRSLYSGRESQPDDVEALAFFPRLLSTVGRAAAVANGSAFAAADRADDGTLDAEDREGGTGAVEAPAAVDETPCRGSAATPAGSAAVVSIARQMRAV